VLLHAPKQEVINGAQVICSTLAGVPHHHLDQQVGHCIDQRLIKLCDE
jgi:hypothetical protein